MIRGTYTLDAAVKLSDLADEQMKNKQYSEAENSFTESIAIRRELAKSSPGEFLSGLSTALNNFANMLQSIDRDIEAENNYIEAIKIKRELAELNSNELPGLAIVLSNMAYLQHKANHQKEAEAIYIEESEIYKKLAQTSPDKYLPKLIKKLLYLSALQKETERYEESKTSYIEMLEIQKKLLEINPELCLPDVISSGDALTQKEIDALLAGVGGSDAPVSSDDSEDLQLRKKISLNAEAAYTLALAIYRKLVEIDTSEYLAGMALVLNNLAGLQQSNNKHDESEANYTEVLEIYRKLADTKTEEYLYKLAEKLEYLAGVYKKNCRYEESKTYYKEFLEIRRKLIEINPNAYLPSLPKPVPILSQEEIEQLLAAINSEDMESQQTQKEYFFEYDVNENSQRLASIKPDEYLPELVKILCDLSEMEKKVYRIQEADELTKEKENIYAKMRLRKNELTTNI
ncbi:MAG: tetratricopeptide repeat protein [Treponema sp.]|nr:tetratricopeptide repeat protein [Treponema sp.]